MREILFRGKPLGKIDEDFVYGSLGVISTDLVAIYQCEEYYDDIITLVDIGTVGQYTGLTDKNGKKIFEGDILRFAYNEEDKDPKIYSVEWKSDRACFGYAETADKMLEIDTFHCEVIGNIHDNPELLKGGEE